MVEELLIEKVRGYSFLYDSKQKHYRDSNIRQAAWEEIGKELQMSGKSYLFIFISSLLLIHYCVNYH